MVDMDCENSLIVKAAWYYYIENMTRQKTSEELGISRMKVIELLEEAKQTGATQFKVSLERSRQLMIEQKLITQWNLKDILVAPAPLGGSNLNEAIAQTAAMHVGDRLTEDMFINMGYRDTPSRVLDRLATITESPIFVVSLTEGVSCYLPNIRSNIFNARLYLYPAPLLVSSKEICKTIHSEPPIEEIARMVRLAIVAVIGIGAINDDATIISNGILNQNDLLYLSMQRAMGDILTHFIDKDGEPTYSNMEERLFSTPLETLKSLNNVIGISGGSQRVEVIYAALKGGYLDTLATDEGIAMQLIDLN